MSEVYKMLDCENLQKKLFNIAKSYTLDEQSALDLVQAANLKALEKEDQFKGNKIDPWITRILQNEFKDKQKRGTFVYKKKELDSKEYDEFFRKALKKFNIDSPKSLKSEEEKKKFFDYVNKNKFTEFRAKREYAFGEKLPKNLVIDDTDSLLVERDIKKCLNNLQKKERYLLALKNSHSYKEISQELEIKEGTLRQQHSRIKEKFMICMGYIDE